VTQDDTGALVCGQCGTVRPVVCTGCGSQRVKNLRLGVTRAREELEALAGRPVVEVTATSAPLVREVDLAIGTEAVLHQVHEARVVIFLDFDQELLAPRVRVAEQAMGLLVRAARLVGGRDRGGRVVVQTRLPRHEVLDAALHGDPGRLVAAERSKRSLLGFPPFCAMAVVSGAAAEAFVGRLGYPRDLPEGIDVLGPNDGRYLVRAPDHRTLARTINATERPPGRLRIEVDPQRI
jgi:primosomal protein N' (replication factor Y)